MHTRNSYLLASVALFASCVQANATNTSSVFSPDVREGTAAFEYRLSVVPDDEGDAVAHRLHFQQALNGSWRYRVIGLIADDGADGYEFRYGRLELQWQFLEDETAGRDSGVRFELQIADPDYPPSRGRIGWAGKWDLGSGWEMRLNALAGHEFGADSDNGFLIETRAQVTYAIAEGWKVGVDLFNDFNNTEAIGAFNDQEHQMGPVIIWRTGDFSVLASVLFGLTDQTDDLDFRLQAIWSF